MNVVIYEPNLNPLTIIDLPESALKVGLHIGVVEVQAYEGLTGLSVMDVDRPQVFNTFRLEFKRLCIAEAEGYCIIARDKALKTWLMPPYGQARTPSEFLRNRDELASVLRQVLARGVGGH
jgi:hypothetical protein